MSIIFPKELVDIFENPKFFNKTGKANARLVHNNKEIFEKFIKQYNLKNTRQVIYLYKNHLTEIPICKTCGKKLTNFENEKQYCSIKCVSNSKEVKDKRIKTFNKNYGCDNPFQSEKIKLKSKQTCKEKYGTDYYQQSNKGKEQLKQSWNEKSEEEKQKILDKRLNTNIENYGIDFPVKLQEIQNKIKKTCQEKLGVDNPSQSNVIKNKKEQTILNHYGVKNPFQSEEIKNKIKETNQERYGCDNPFQLEEFKKHKRKEYFAIFIENIKYKFKFLDTEDSYINDEKHQYKCLKCGNEFTSEATSLNNLYCPHCYHLHKQLTCF